MVSTLAAPTLVSELVHSTLVTAGAYLMVRFNRFLIETCIRMISGFFSIITIFISGIMANYENDFKKIIALSTLSQLGLIVMILRFEFRLIAYYYLLVHQDIRLLGNLNEIMPFVTIRLLISNIALRGVPFMLGFYRKDLIIEVIYRKMGVIYLYLF
ncbi:NU5M oxidoreductase, partial [Acromyrmex charruanus]